MTIENLIAVLGWSMVINFGIFLVWVIFTKAMPELTYKTQTLVTHFGPYMALRIVYA
jgi:hypothetical protein